LIVRVNHHDNVRSCGQSLPVTGLLVPAVPIVFFVNENLQAETPRDT